MPKFKPGTYVNGEYKKFKTFAELKKKLPELIQEHNETTLTTYRSRRGEWGEWFEEWTLDSRGKAVVVREGWG